MISRSTLLDKIGDYIHQATALERPKIIPGNDNNPGPLDSYATVLSVSETSIGVDSTLQEKEMIKTKSIREIEYSVQFFRAGAEDYTAKLLYYHALPEAQIYLETMQFTIKECVNLSNTTQMIAQDYENRSSVTLRIWLKDDMISPVDYYTSSNITVSENTITENFEVEK